MAEKPKKAPKDMKLMSLGEFYANTKREEISSVLVAGFRVWMKQEKGTSLRSRMMSQWDQLFNDYLKRS